MSTSTNLPNLYEKKENIQEKPEIPRINKIIADDMNIIRELLLNCTYISNDELKNINNESINPKISRYEELKKNNYIVAHLSKRQPIANGSQAMLIDTAESEGDFFELNENEHTIKVLKDCTALISAAIFVDGTAGDGYIWGHIRISGNNIASKLDRIFNADYTQCSIASIPKKLSAGDTISIAIDYSSVAGSPTIRNSNDSTYLSIVKF